jgi:hypothetical protein
VALLAAAASRAALSRLKKRYFSCPLAGLKRPQGSTYSTGVELGWPEGLSVVGVVTASKSTLTTVVEVWDTVSDEWVGVGIVDLLSCQQSSLLYTQDLQIDQ